MRPSAQMKKIKSHSKPPRSWSIWLAVSPIAVGILCWMLLGSTKLGSIASLFFSNSDAKEASTTTTSSLTNFECLAQKYTTEIISLDPLLIYIRDFFNKQDIDGILGVGEGRFQPSEVYRDGRLTQNQYRTSSSASLPEDHPAVSCVLERARRFLGTTLDPVSDEMGAPQLVRYTTEQYYNLHHDWLKTPQPAFDGSPRSFNRVASFFVILQDNCTDGETWFPFIRPVAPQGAGSEEGRLWREQEEGGLAFKPVAGNALFWVNLFPNGTGDERTVHGGMPLKGGLKTAMNIWPRKYRPNE